MAKNRLAYLACLAGAALFYLYYYAWFSWYILILALALPLLSFIVSLPAMLGIVLEFSSPGATDRGTPAALQIKNVSPSVMPTPAFHFRLRVTDTLTGAVSTKKIALSGGRGHTAAIPAAHCGCVVCQGDKGGIYDYLGLFRLPFALPGRTETLILPVAAPPTPLPNLSQFQYKTYHPKNGGGFAEIHDMRSYRPGDSMRDIHWKLSTKLDSLIVREPQEPDRGLVLLTFDLAGPPADLDSVLDQLLWLSQWLLDRDTIHDIRWLDPGTLTPMSHTVSAPEDLENLTLELLRTPLAEGSPSIAARSFPSTVWRYHVAPVRKEADHG